MAVDVQVAIWIIQQRLKDKPPFEFETPTRTRDKKKIYEMRICDAR